MLSRVWVSATVIHCGFWIWSRFIWILTVTTKVIHFTDLQHTNFTVESSVRRLLRSPLNWLDPSLSVSVSWLSVSSVSHLLKRILCRPQREHPIVRVPLNFLHLLLAYSFLQNPTVKACVSMVTAYYIRVFEAAVVSVFVTAESEQVLIVDVA
jgi:hypothetical protein